MLVWNCLPCLKLPSGLMRWESGLLGIDINEGRGMIRLHQGEESWEVPSWSIFAYDSLWSYHYW